MVWELEGPMPILKISKTLIRSMVRAVQFGGEK
jgi:hypothetical protein